jgi:hypothetical protein
MEENEDQILAFWQWFVKNEVLIKDSLENSNSIHREGIVEQFNEYILGLGVLTWDVGVNENDKWFLMLSPNGNKEMLLISEKIMEASPGHMNWLFYSSRPAKDWNREFVIYDNDMDEQKIDASQWHYIVLEDDEGELELLIEAKNLSHLELDVSETAVEQFLIGEVGEATLMRRVSSIELVHTFEEEYEASKSQVSELKEHLNEDF